MQIRMIAVARERGLRLGVVLQNRYNSPMQQVRRVVDEGRLGRLYLGSACVRWYRPQLYYDDEWHGTWAMDGGALMNQNIHHIDDLSGLWGRAMVFAYTATLAHRMEAEDVGVAVIRFAAGPWERSRDLRSPVQRISKARWRCLASMGPRRSAERR